MCSNKKDERWINITASLCQNIFFFTEKEGHKNGTYFMTIAQNIVVPNS
jgi:hypothetical protein